MQQGKDFIDSLGVYIYVILVAIIGGLLNTKEKAKRSTGRKVADFIVGLISSCFFGWMGFELINFIYQNEKIALAGCGFFAWKGTEWIETLIERILDKLLKDDKDVFEN